MCGIAGFTAPDPQAHAILSHMLAAIAHRGPDGSGQHVTSAIAFGHVRLAIVDLAGGAQPRVDPASGDALIFNGEIYGFRALAQSLTAAGIPLADQSDTEVLFQALRHWGVAETLARVDGMFAFAFWHAASATLTLARDRFGEKPLFWAHSQGQLFFASECSALLAHPKLAHCAPDMAAAYALLQFEYVPGTASGWSGIEKLPPGCLLQWSGGEPRLHTYWHPPHAAPQTPTDAADELDTRLRGAISRQLVADVKLGVFLSGGIDSSLITAIAAEMAPDITALTVRAGTGDFDETEYARLAARHIGVRHEIVDLAPGELQDAMAAIEAHLSEPLADSSLLPTYLVCRAARARMTVALGGDGADELFAGYPNFRVQRWAGVMRHFPPASGTILGAALDALPPGQGYMNFRFRLRQLAQGFGAHPARQSYLWMAPFGPAEMDAIWAPGALPGPLAQSIWAPVDAAHAASSATGAEALLHQFLLTYLPDDILMKTDRAAMFNGLEVRSPFLDRGFAEYACALPLGAKLGPLGAKHALKQVARRYLPEAVITRRKHGFAVPVGSLLRGIFAERLADTLLSPSHPLAGWFHRPRLEQLIRRHAAGEADCGKRLWALLILFIVYGRKPPLEGRHG